MPNKGRQLTNVGNKAYCFPVHKKTSGLAGKNMVLYASCSTKDSVKKILKFTKLSNSSKDNERNLLPEYELHTKINSTVEPTMET